MQILSFKRTRHLNNNNSCKMTNTVLARTEKKEIKLRNYQQLDLNKYQQKVKNCSTKD